MEEESNKANLDIHIVLVIFNYSKFSHEIFLPAASRIRLYAASLCTKNFVLFLDHEKTKVNEAMSGKLTYPSPFPSQKKFELCKGLSEVFWSFAFQFSKSVGLRSKVVDHFFKFLWQSQVLQNFSVHPKSCIYKVF